MPSYAGFKQTIRARLDTPIEGQYAPALNPTTANVGVLDPRASAGLGGRILLIPGSYLVITTLQNNVVSPLAYGRRLKLNPVAVLVGVLFWWFLWGVPGAFLAVPVIATAKIMGDHIESLQALGEFLAD